MKPINFRRVLIISGLLILVIVYSILWLRMISTPAERTGTDFMAFYAAGRAAQMKGIVYAYDIEAVQTVQQEQISFKLASGQVALYNHIPYLIPVLVLLVNENYITSFVFWIILLLAIYGISAGVLARLLTLEGFPRRNLVLILAGLLTFFPLFVSLLLGQDTAFLFLGACLWLMGLILKRDTLAGIGLALMTVRPHIAIFLAIPFLFQRRKVFWWFCIGAGVLAMASLIMLGVGGVKAYLNILLISAGGNWYGMNEIAMVNLIGLLKRAAPFLDEKIVHNIGWGVYIIAISGLCVLWAKNREIGARQAGIAIVLALFAAPHLHYHDLTLLIIPLVAFLLLLVREQSLSKQSIALIPISVSLILLLSNSIPIIKYSLPYLVMLLLFLELWFPEKILHPKPT